MSRTADRGLGYAPTPKPRRQDHDALLAKLVEKRNAVHRLRDNEKEATRRAALQGELREAQKGVRKRLAEVRTRTTASRNSALLKNNSKNPRVYWDLLKKTVGIHRKRTQIPDDALFDGVVVSGDKIQEVWKEAFRRISAVDPEESAFSVEFLEEIQQEVKAEMLVSHQFDSLNDDLNRPIVEDEVILVLRNLKQGKAAGWDRLVNELFKHGGEGIGKATAKLCEEMFRLERIPRAWARGLIFPLYKDGDARVPENSRGITLLSVVGKIYTTVLNKRVTSWCEKFGVLSEEQAGFRPGRSTVDHILSVAEVLRLRRKQRKQTHCCFLDIKKAYDTVHRDGLWKRLIEVGIRGKMWRVLKNVYDIVESCVLVGKEQTEWFSVEAGVRQGCILSPILFAVFIDGLARALRKVRVESILDNVKLNFLLFADDIVLLAKSKQDLQKLLNAAFNYSERWRFAWNCSKSKVMRFGVPKCKKQQIYFLGLQELEVVNSFKYLGVDIQQNLSWSTSKWRFTLKARSRVPMVTKAVIEGLSINAGIKLWETMVRPTLEYAAEAWGGGNWLQAEQIQNTVGRTLLGLSSKTAMEVARGELGWISMKARRELKLLRYWGKLLKMEDSRLVKQIYRSCKPVTTGLKGSFCHSIQNTLVNLNLGHLWLSEQIGELKDWMSLAKACVKRKDLELWAGALQKKAKLRVYRQLKSDLRQEEFLAWALPPKQRVLYARLRSGTHQLRIETGRWRKEPEEERVCKVCITGSVESEAHFLLDCYVYNRLRQSMFKQIKATTGYDIASMMGDREWLMDVLLGHGLPQKETRRLIGQSVAWYLATAFRVRARILKP